MPRGICYGGVVPSRDFFFAVFTQGMYSSLCWSILFKVWEPGLSRGGFSPRCKLLLVGSFNITIGAQMLCLIECFQNDILWASSSVTLIRADTAQQSFHQLALLFCAISCGGIAL